MVNRLILDTLGTWIFSTTVNSAPPICPPYSAFNLRLLNERRLAIQSASGANGVAGAVMTLERVMNFEKALYNG